MWQVDKHGPFSDHWGSLDPNGTWTSGPWTSWWGRGGCPNATWTGWTQGNWQTAPPWTNWSACHCSTTATKTITSTVSGGVTTTKEEYDLAVAGSTAISTAGSATGTSSAAQRPRQSVGAMAIFILSIICMMN